MPDQEDDILNKEIQINVKSIFKYLGSKWLLFFILGILGAAGGLLVAHLIKPKYTASLTFVLSSETKTSSIAGLASQFGLDIGGNSNDVFSGDNILTLFNSEKMIRAVLLKKPPSNTEVLANIIVREWGWDDKWENKERTKNSFPFPDDVDKLSPIQDSLIREIHLKIIENFLSVSRLDKKLSVYKVSTTSTNQIFACYLTQYLMDETARFYIETKTSISKVNLKMLQKEADSLRDLLGGVISSGAMEAERTFNLNPALLEQRAPAQKSQVRATVLATAYGEVVKNLEIAKVTLQKETPLYQIIDTPRLPLKEIKLSKILAILAGISLMWLLALLFLIFKKTIQ